MPQNDALMALLGGLGARPQAPSAQVMVGGNKNLTPRVQQVAEGLNAPIPNWNIVILDHDQWANWSQRNPNASKTDGAFSLLGTGRTYIDQDWLVKNTPERLQHNLAHEMGHLVSNSPDEGVAERTKDAYFKTKTWTPFK